LEAAALGRAGGGNALRADGVAADEAVDAARRVGVREDAEADQLAAADLAVRRAVVGYAARAAVVRHVEIQDAGGRGREVNAGGVVENRVAEHLDAERAGRGRALYAVRGERARRAV